MHKEEKMSEKEQKKATTDPRPEYEPPRALSLSDMHTGTGGQILPCSVGSSALDCSVGNIAEFCTNGSTLSNP